jgi:hypothetical protein
MKMEFNPAASIALCTIRANSCEFDSVGQHLVTTNLFSSVFDGANRFHMNIVHSTACAAPYVVMVSRGRVETPLGARDVHFPNKSFLGQNLKVAIHGSNTDLGKPVFNQSIEFLGRRVASKLSEFFQYYSALLRHSAWRFRVHQSEPSSIANANQ